MIESTSKFIKYWVHRYMLRTELYMVEKWERIFIHVFFAVAFVMFYFFNSMVVLNFTAFLVQFIKSSFMSYDSLALSVQNYLSCIYKCANQMVESYL